MPISSAASFFTPPEFSSARRIVTRLSLNRMRTLARRREDYVGEWLPEPLLTSPDVADDVELADSVSFAMLTVLETLAPTERAVFVLREVFGVPAAEVAVTHRWIAPVVAGFIPAAVAAHLVLS